MISDQMALHSVQLPLLMERKCILCLNQSAFSNFPSDYFIGELKAYQFHELQFLCTNIHWQD